MRIALAAVLAVAAACGGKDSSGPSLATEPGEIIDKDYVFRGELPKGWELRGSLMRPPSGLTRFDVAILTWGKDIADLATERRAKAQRNVVGVRDNMKQLGNGDLIPKGMGDAEDIDRAGRRGYVVTDRTPGQSGSRSADLGYNIEIFWKVDDVIARCDIRVRDDQAPAYRALIDICFGLEVTKK